MNDHANLSIHRSNASHDRGFTLLELIIASSLATTLLLIVWSLFGIYTKLDEKGNRQATELQLVRSLMRQVRSDVHRVIIAQPNLIDAVDFVSTDGGFDDPLLVLDGPPLVGTESTLRFAVLATPNRRDTGTAAVAAIYDIVKYHWKPRATIGVPGIERNAVNEPTSASGEWDFEADRETVPDGPLSTGFTRSLIPWGQETQRGSLRRGGFTSSGVGESSDLMAAQPVSETPFDRPRAERDVVPEMIRLRFRYSDGNLWRNRWDSSQEGRLPAAIEMQFELEVGAEESRKLDPAPPDEVVIGQFESGQFDSEPFRVWGDDSDNIEHSAEYRFVIALASAGPGQSTGATLP